MGRNSLRLLIVDDEQAARYGMRRTLGSVDYEIAEAGSVEEARALMRSQDFELLLLDVNLPGVSGLEFLKELQSSSSPAKGEAPLVIIITAHGSERLAVEAVKSGAYDYLSKPFEVDDLRLVVKNAFETIQLRRENRSRGKSQSRASPDLPASQIDGCARAIIQLDPLLVVFDRIAAVVSAVRWREMIHHLVDDDFIVQ